MTITPMKHIRTEVLKLSQTAMGKLLDVGQSAVARWDSGDTNPSYAQMLAIRQLAKKQRGVRWDDAYFFQTRAARRPRAAKKSANG